MKKTNKIYTIKEQAYNIIKKDLLSGEIEPGTWLQENELAVSLQVSRSPVREALKQLAGEGLVENIPNKGVFAKKLSVQEVGEIFDLRCIIERYSIEKAIHHLVDQDIKDLDAIIRRMEHHFEKNDVDGYVKTDGDLHYHIIYLSRNTIIHKAVTNVFSLLQPFRILSLIGEQRFQESIDEHRGIVQGIKEKDFKAAWKWNSIHLTKARKDVLERVRQNCEEK